MSSVMSSSDVVEVALDVVRLFVLRGVVGDVVGDVVGVTLDVRLFVLC